MAGSRAALVLGPVGGDGWITPDSYPRLEADGLAGRATDAVLDANALAEQLAAWRPAMGNDSRDLVTAHHDVRDHVTELMALAGELVPEPLTEPSHEDELVRLIRLEWQRSADVLSARRQSYALAAERERLVEQLAAQAQQLAAQAAEHAALAHQLGAQAAELRHVRELADDNATLLSELRLTRRWRLACALARPADLMRRRRARRNAAPAGGGSAAGGEQELVQPGLAGQLGVERDG